MYPRLEIARTPLHFEQSFEEKSLHLKAGLASTRIIVPGRLARLGGHFKS